MNDQTIPADKVREILDTPGLWAIDMIAKIEALLPAPKLPTLADMTPKERSACQWMQADMDGADEGWLIIDPLDSGYDAHIVNREGFVRFCPASRVTPRPDLPRMEWPGDQKAALEETPESEEEFMANIEKALDDHYGPLPAPALPDGWRLADHEDYGRGIVTNPTTTRDGRVYFVIPADDPMGYDWFSCRSDDLTYLDTDQEVEDVTTVKAGDVIESADDPRLDALPIGSILLDRDGEAVTKRREEWEGGGRIPIPYEGEVFGPWTVLHIGEKADQ